MPRRRSYRPGDLVTISREGESYDAVVRFEDQSTGTVVVDDVDGHMHRVIRKIVRRRHS